MSALPLIATEERTSRDVSKVPIGDMGNIKLAFFFCLQRPWPSCNVLHEKGATDKGEVIGKCRLVQWSTSSSSCALSGIIIAVVSEVAKRSPAFGALIVFVAFSVSISNSLALARHGRYGTHCQPYAIDLLVYPTVAADVPSSASDAACWRRFLAKHGRELRSDSYPLFHHSLVARQVRDQSMSGGATSDSAMKIISLCNAALLLVPLVWAHGAHAHGIAGNRYFDGTLTFDDPAVADEAILPYYENLAFPTQGSNATQNRINWAFARLLTPTLAFHD